jgi:acyl-CoA synthetase (AMP-forming)/AMP-acid ligase II
MQEEVEISRHADHRDYIPPMLGRIGDYLVHNCARHPQREAAVLGDRRLRYGELGDSVDRCVRALLANEVRRGDRVAVLTTPRPEYLIIFLALARIGAIWVGLNPRYRLRELRQVIEDAKPVLLLGLSSFESRDLAAELRQLLRECMGIRRFVPFEAFDPFLDEAASVKEQVLHDACGAVQGTDPLCIVYTSGTTGVPRGAVLSHRAFIVSYTTQLQYWPVQPLRILNNLPVNHIGGLGDVGTYCLIGGGTQIMMERFDPLGALEATRRERISVWYQMVAQFQRIVALPEFADADLSSLELAIWGDGPIPVSLIEQLRLKARRVATSYGLSEGCGPLTYTAPDADLDVLSQTIGKPAKEYEIRLADSQGKRVKQGEIGEIQLRGEFVMSGYFGRPDVTAEAIDNDGWLHSGDLALERADGNFALVGRIKEMFKSGGYNVYPREIELVLQAHASVQSAAVVAVPDLEYQEVGHAFVLRRPDAYLDEVTIERHCRTALANYKIPKRFHMCGALPILPNGKIDKAVLRSEAMKQRRPIMP